MFVKILFCFQLRIHTRLSFSSPSLKSAGGAHLSPAPDAAGTCRAVKRGSSAHGLFLCFVFIKTQFL